MATIEMPAFDAPDDSWLVYADALQAAGDPRGELIAINHAIATNTGAKRQSSEAERLALLKEHADAIYGPLKDKLSLVEIEWKWCVAAQLTLTVEAKHDIPGLAKALLASPVLEQLQALRVVVKTPTETVVKLQAPLKALAAGLPESCTSLEIIDERAQRSRILVSADYDPSSNLVELGSLDTLWSMKQLESLRLIVADTEQIELGTIDAPALREFAFLGLRWAQPYSGSSRMAQTLAEASWPKLESLALRIPETYTYSWPEQYGAYRPVARYDEENEYYDDYYDDDGYHEDVNWSAEFGGLLQALRNTPLRRLSMTSFASSANLLRAFSDHGLPETLKVLDLSESDLNDENVEWFTSNAGLLAQLDSLDLSDTLISDASPLAALDCEVVHSPGSGARYRFSVGME